MKHIHVTACCKVNISPRTQWVGDFFRGFQEVNKICVDSFRRNFPEIESIIIGGEVETWDDYCLTIHRTIKEIYLDNHPCKLLFTGSDVVAVRPCDIFKHTDFRMFADAQIKFNKYGFNFNPYYNSDVRLYGNKLKKGFWEFSDKTFEEMPKGFWEYEQVAYNEMLYNQKDMDYINNDYHYIWNIGSDVPGDAAIYHCNTSRGIEGAKKRMLKAIGEIKI